MSELGYKVGNIQVGGATADATAAAHASEYLVAFRQVAEFVHEALAPALTLGSTGVMTRCVDGKAAEAATVPAAYAPSFGTLGFVLHVEAAAHGAYVGAGAAAYAGQRLLFERLAFEEGFQAFGKVFTD